MVLLVQSTFAIRFEHITPAAGQSNPLATLFLTSDCA